MLCFLAVALLAVVSKVNGRVPGKYIAGPWQSAHATFYGGDDASGTMGIPFIFLHSYSLACNSCFYFITFL